MYFLPKFKRGVFNKYRRDMPWPEMLAKDLGVVVFYLKNILSGKRPNTLVCYPHFPSRGSTIYRIAKAMGWQVSNKLNRVGKVAVFWEYGTRRKEWQMLENLKNVSVINLQSRDIGKDYVDAKMQEAMGYCSKIDPKTFHGIAVKKSITNAVHDGQEITCPIANIEEGFIYQKLVDTSNGNGEVMDMRVVIMKNEIPHLYANFRKLELKFSNRPHRAELVMDINSMLSQKEQDDLIRFSKASGLDFCELDVLRDNGDGKIYVVDANNTPQGPPVHLPVEEKKIAMKSYLGSFKRQFLNQD